MKTWPVMLPGGQTGRWRMEPGTEGTSGREARAPRQAAGAAGAATCGFQS